MTIIHQLPFVSARCDSDSILPQEMISGGSPSPIKLKVASAAMALRIFITIINIIEERKFGNRWRTRIWKKLPPIHFAAVTYPLLRICRTSVRMTFAMLNHPVMPITAARVMALASPQIACKKIINSRFGTLNNSSDRRINRASSQAGARPQAVPYKMAAPVDIAVAAKPMNSDNLPPYHITENRSRPIVSVPNQNSRFGGTLQFAKSMQAGSFGIKSSQQAHPRMIMTRKKAESQGACCRTIVV